jgi:hypothetical protein
MLKHSALMVAVAATALVACTHRGTLPARDIAPRSCPNGYYVKVINPLSVDYDVIAFTPSGMDRTVGTVSAGSTQTFTLSPDMSGQVRVKPSFEDLHPVHFGYTGGPTPGSVTTKVTCM